MSSVRDSESTVEASLRSSWSPVPLQLFQQHCKALAADSNAGFTRQFQELRDVGNEQTKTTAELEANKSKNRYQSVLPYDHSIVKLTPIDSEPNSDYINANFIPGYSSLQEFICTQGPLRSTTTDFWRMVWEQNVRSVVMLTLCKEHGKVLCEPYWPALDSTQGYGQVEVTTLSQSCSQDWRVSQLKLYHSSTHTERRVSHFYYTAWPDCGVPRTPASMTSFTEHVREQLNKTEGAGPTVVHCSAGVGRTGTFITLDWLLQQLKSGSAVDVPGIVHKLRRSRCLMVQTLDQYIFIHTCLLLKITQEGQAAAHNQQRRCAEKQRRIRGSRFISTCMGPDNQHIQPSAGCPMDQTINTSSPALAVPGTRQHCCCSVGETRSKPGLTVPTTVAS
ncbi:receptor-type tyrosine-protein phosphatase V-like [Huso huso]|uniref:Receptor-type tyrosine-protein phosphatase V-like n=1 Tax=Huso huso TaxID=61971 RepID=A0ABR0YMR5_HUSHU